MTLENPQKSPELDTKPTVIPNKPDKSLLKCSDTTKTLHSQIVREHSGERMLQTHEAPADMPKRKKFGRPTKYKAIYCDQIIRFFNREHTYESEVTHTNRKGESWTSYQTKANPVPFMVDFAEYIGIDVATLFRWGQKHSDFCKATTHAQDMQLRHLATITGMGLYNAMWSVFMAKNISNWRDKKDIEHSGSIDSKLLFDKMVDKSKQAIEAENRIGQFN